MVESICVNSQRTFYSRRSGVRLRPAPEMEICLAYDPAGPHLYVLNTTAWLVLLLCDHATRDTIATGFYEQVEPLLTPQQAAAQTEETIADLLAKNLIEARDGGKRQRQP